MLEKSLKRALIPQQDLEGCTHLPRARVTTPVGCSWNACVWENISRKWKPRSPSLTCEVCPIKHTDLRIFTEKFLTTKLHFLTQGRYLGRQTQNIKTKIFQKRVGSGSYSGESRAGNGFSGCALQDESRQVTVQRKPKNHHHYNLLATVNTDFQNWHYHLIWCPA